MHFSLPDEEHGRGVMVFASSMRKPVLLVIDMLNDFLEKWERPERKRLVSAVNELVAFMRKAP